MTGGAVIVLGRTGRNFAAGMSGGMAFILDIDPALVNTEMVDLLALPLNQEEFVKNSISKFFIETGSEVASEVLNDWPNNKNRITLVMPRDYARVLDLMAKAQREGLPVEDAVMAVING
jgi:glutamate synthase (NADPH/NADH) large chain